MGGIFRAASSRLLATMPAGHLPFFLRVLGPRLPPEATEAFLAKNFYDIARARWNAFERGAELARRIDA